MVFGRVRQVVFVHSVICVKNCCSQEKVVSGDRWSLVREVVVGRFNCTINSNFPESFTDTDVNFG